MNTKKCSKCGRELPLTDFNKNRNSKDGLQEACRSCFSKYNRERYAKNREKIKSDVKDYRKNNPENVFDTRMRICEKNPTMVNAQKAVYEAVKAGIIERPRHCSGCGCSDEEHRIEAHHSDYSKPLDVIWLCTPCHRELDKRRITHDCSTAWKRVV